MIRLLDISRRILHLSTKITITNIQEFTMFIQALKFQTAGTLGVMQFGTSDQNTFRYSPVDIGIKKGTVQVKETSDAGSVNSLIVLNTSDYYVFLMDGDILAGAKQNRIINTSVLLAPQSKTIIPVSCVEAGRWRAVSSQFSSTDHTAPSNMRKMKSENVSHSIRESRGFDANQGAIWNSVSEYSKKYSVESPTSNYSDVYEAGKKGFDQGLEKIVVDPNANGVIFFIDKTIINVDIFGSKRVYSHYFPKLLRGVSMEIFGRKSAKEQLTEAQAKYDMVEFLDGWDALKKERNPGVGLGTEHRVMNEKFSGMDLEYNEQKIHTSIFNAATIKQS